MFTTIAKIGAEPSSNTIMFKFLEENLVVDCIKSFLKIKKFSHPKCLFSREFLIDQKNLLAACSPTIQRQTSK